MGSYLRIALIAVSLALDVFAVCVGVGAQRPAAAARVRIGLAFGTAEVTMNVIGAIFGQLIGRMIGDTAAYLGFGALVGLGIYMIAESLRGGENKLQLGTGWGLFIASLSISLDSLGIGFTLPYLGVSIYIALVAIFVASVISTASGLAVGEVIGERAGEAAGFFAGVILAVTGVGFAIARHQGLF